MAKIYVIAGPSASGKTTLVNFFLKQNILKLISSTSRKPRIGEVDGIDYYFINKKDFNHEDFVEFTQYVGEYYGLSKKEVHNKLNYHDQVFCILEQTGLRAIKKEYKEDVVTIGIKLDKETAEKRMRKRGDSPESIERRLINFDKQNEGEIWKKTDCWIDGNQSIEDMYQNLMDILSHEKDIPSLVERKLTIPPITADPLAVFFKERKEEAALFARQEQQVIETWKQIINNPNFKALEFRNRINQKLRLHPSSRENIDWQLTFFCKNGEPVMHENYVSNNAYRHLGYCIKDLYSDLARYSLDNTVIQVTIFEEKEHEPLSKRIESSKSKSEQLVNERQNKKTLEVDAYGNYNSFVK